MRKRHLPLLLLVPVVWLLVMTAYERPSPATPPPAASRPPVTERPAVRPPAESVAQPVPIPARPSPDSTVAPAAQQPVVAAATGEPPPRRLVLRGESAPEFKAPAFADGSGREAIHTALREITPGLRDCYQQGLTMDPALSGRLVLELTVEARAGVGRIIDATIDEEATTLPAVLVLACALDQLSDAVFPAPRDHQAITFRYPFTFAAPRARAAAKDVVIDDTDRAR